MKKFWKPPFLINEKAKKLILTMKLTVFILFLTLMQVSATVYSQATKFSFRAENKQVVEVLRQIEEKSDFRFFFLREQVDVERKVTVTARDATVEQILDELFRGEPVSYEFANEALIVLTRSDNPLGSVSSYLQGNIQQLAVSGTVTDESGEPLPGVTVIVKGTTQGTVTNAVGNYSLSNIPEDATLVFSFIGMRTQEVVVGIQTSINVEMEIDAIGIEEVVAVGYGTMKKSDLTGSLSSVTPEDFENQPLIRLDQALQGRATGAQVIQASGEPGGGFKVRIRGVNSITGDNEPLYVVDGIVVDAINTINANDIASMEVLKDASATAIYGSRGANGVVLITTKNGTREETKITFDAYTGIAQVTKTLDFMNAGEWAEAVNHYQDAEIFTQEEISYYYENGGVDWQDEVFKSAPFSNYLVTMQGGNDNIDFYISGDYYNAEGIVIKADYSRYSLRAKFNADLSEKIKIGFNVTGSRIEDTGRKIQLSKALPRAPTTPIYDEEGNFNEFDPQGRISTSGKNPMMQPELFTDESFSDRIAANGYFNFEIVNNLTLDISAGVDRIGSKSNSYTPIAWNRKGTAGVDNSIRNRFQNTNRLTYVYENPKHRLQIDAIHEQHYYKRISTNADAEGFFTDSPTWKILSLASIQRVSNSASDESLQSALGRINYSLLSKYLFTATLRADGSSKFREGHRWGYFPSGSVGWRISEEGFLKGSTTVNNLKMRASYGITGSQAVGALATRAKPRVTSGINYPFTQSAAFIGVAPSNRMANKELSWEETAMWNVGLDLGLWESRVTLVFDAYRKHTYDLLLDRPLPNFVGPTVVTENVGEVENKGFEFTLGFNPVRTKDWNLTSNLTFSRNLNKVLSLINDEPITLGTSVYGGNLVRPTRVEVGKPISSFRGLIFEGVWQLDEAEEAAKYKRNPGDAKYKDLNGDYLYTIDDVTAIGDGNPDFIFGWNTTLDWKGLSMNFLFTGSYGNDIYSYMHGMLRGLGGASPILAEYNNRWTPENPSNITSNSDTHTVTSTEFIEDGSHIALKNVSLGYTFFRNSAFDRIGLDLLRVYGSVENVFFLTKYSLYDPESTRYNNDIDVGIDRDLYPLSRKFTVGVKLTF